MIDDNKSLVMWTIYDHPRDYPDSFVARKFLIAGGAPTPTSEIILSTSLDKLRAIMVGRGLSCITRSPGDDPVVVETWL